MIRKQKKLKRGLEGSIVTLIILISAIVLAIAVIGFAFGIFGGVSSTPNISYYQGISSPCVNGAYLTYTIVNLNGQPVAYTLVALNGVSIVGASNGVLTTKAITAVVTIFVPASVTGFVEVLANGHSALAITA